MPLAKHSQPAFGTSECRTKVIASSFFVALSEFFDVPTQSDVSRWSSGKKEKKERETKNEDRQTGEKNPPLQKS